MNSPMNRNPAGISNPEQDQTVGALLKQLAREIPSLFTKELALAKAEARESLRATKTGVAAVATGGAVMLAGLMIALMAGVYGLSNVMPNWLAALIVGVAALIVGWAMVAAGKQKFEPDALKPDHTIHSLKKDKDAISGRSP